jgi:3-oxoacyl-[acyl-carrier-protein] synthase-3
VPDVDAYVFHQANQFINNQVARKIGIKSDKTPTTLYDFGNTSSATIPLTITAKLRDRIAAEPQKLVMTGFGVGLSWASTYWDAENVACPELVEV